MHARIAIISEHASPLADIGGVDSGGQNVYVAQIAKHLAMRGYKVDVFTRRDNPYLPEIVTYIDGVRVIHVKAGPAEFVKKEHLLPYMEEFASNLIHFCNKQIYQYDVLHANFWTSGLVAQYVKEVLSIPFVMTYHALGHIRKLYQGDADEFPQERPLLEEQIAKNADKIIAECPQDQIDLITLYNASPSKISIIPCGFDKNEFWPIDKAHARALLGYHPHEKIVLQLGRIVPRKGVETVIESTAILKSNFNVQAKLVIVGGESERPDPTYTPEIGRLQAVIENLGIKNQVHFAGRRGRSMLRYYYGAADIFVTTPWYEPFGITPVEAMACARPVIGSNVGGIKWSIKNGETGYLVPARDSHATAEKIAELYSQPNLCERMGKAARRRALKYFTWDKVAASVATVYQDVISTSTMQIPAVANEGALHY